MNARPATLALSAALLMAAEAQAQRFVAVPPPPNQPMVEDFDPERPIFSAPPHFTHFRNPEWRQLDYGLGADIEEDTPVLVFEAGGETLVLVSSQMSYHHVAQGEMAGEAWMVTF